MKIYSCRNIVTITIYESASIKLHVYLFLGGWWCHDVCGENNLNGIYKKPKAKIKPERRGICWKSQNGRLYSIKSTKMLIHPIDSESSELTKAI